MVQINMGYIPGERIIISNYKFNEASVADLKRYGIDEIKKKGKENLVRMNCTSEPNGEYLREEGLRMKYSYFDRDSAHIYDIWVSKKDCAQF